MVLSIQLSIALAVAVLRFGLLHLSIYTFLAIMAYTTHVMCGWYSNIIIFYASVLFSDIILTPALQSSQDSAYANYEPLKDGTENYSDEPFTEVHMRRRCTMRVLSFPPLTRVDVCLMEYRTLWKRR